ncbi:hypothetical protein EV1_038275 [Malus domestica]
MDGFREAVHACQLIDMGFVVNSYTWTDNREHEVRCRLDRVFVSQPWLNLFPASWGCHLNPSKSDHLPIWVEIRCSTASPSRKGRKRFRFEKMWLKEESCEGIISLAWNKLVSGFQVCEKIRFTRCALLAWQREVFGFTKAKIAKVWDKLGMLFKHPPSAELYAAKGSYWVNLIHFLGGRRCIGGNVRVYSGYRKGI